MSILILAEHDGEQLSQNVLKALTAAKAWNLPIHVLVAGNNANKVAESAALIDGVARVIQVSAAHFAHPLAEDIANLVVSVSADYSVILATHSSFSRNSLPRVAALLDVAMISDVLAINGNNTYVRAIYAGTILTTVQSVDAIQVLTIHGSKFSAASFGNTSAEIENVSAPSAFSQARWVSEVRSESDRPALGSAKIVVSGGRSLGSAEKFEQLLSPLATKLGAALGATRAAEMQALRLTIFK